MKKAKIDIFSYDNFVNNLPLLSLKLSYLKEKNMKKVRGFEKIESLLGKKVNENSHYIL